MKFAFEIKTEPVMQATIIISVVAFSSGSIVTIGIYLGSALAGIVCADGLFFWRLLPYV
jgi:hypothetical protein